RFSSLLRRTGQSQFLEPENANGQEKCEAGGEHCPVPRFGLNAASEGIVDPAADSKTQPESDRRRKDFFHAGMARPEDRRGVTRPLALSQAQTGQCPRGSARSTLPEATAR